MGTHCYLKNNFRLDPEKLKKCRPVSNLAFISKVIEKIIASRLSEHINKHDLHEEMQSAYKKLHSTETALLRVHNDIMVAVDGGNAVVLVLLDLSAAFDTIDHDILKQRLRERIGVMGTAPKWFSLYLQNRTQQVSFEDVVSSPSCLSFGVPQGSVLGPVLFTLYTLPLGNIARQLEIPRHFYADDTQLYVFFSVKDQHEGAVAVTQLENCVNKIQNWMVINKLKLNADKTELLLIASPYWRDRVEWPLFHVRTTHIVASPSARNMGAKFDGYMSMHDQVNSLCSSAFFHLRNISAIRKCLDRESTVILVHALVTSRLDMCNSLLYGIPAFMVKKLQRIQNFAARIICRIRKFEHITQSLKSLHWLPVEKRIQFKILLIVFKCLNGQSPDYLTKLLLPYAPKRELRSTGRNLLTMQRTHLKSYGDRAFSRAGPKLWNALSDCIRSSQSVEYFKSKLKQHLFTTTYGK